VIGGSRHIVESLESFFLFYHFDKFTGISEKWISWVNVLWRGEIGVKQPRVYAVPREEDPV